jgi:hypothetical protein
LRAALYRLWHENEIPARDGLFDQADAALSPAPVLDLGEIERALEDAPCRCKILTHRTCPQCGADINGNRVKNPGWMNDEQRDAVKAGDWFCLNCKDPETRTGYKYWQDSELPSETKEKMLALCRARQPAGRDSWLNPTLPRNAPAMS